MSDEEPTSGRPPTEGEMLVAMLERRGLNAMLNLHAMRRELEAAGKNPRQSSTYKLYGQELDVLAAALGEALWIRTGVANWRDVKGPDYDERGAGLNRLHELRKEKEKTGG